MISQPQMRLLRQELFSGEKEMVRIMIAILVALRIIFLATIYILSGVKHFIRYPHIGVYDAYAIDPARAVAAFILPFTAMFASTVIALRLRKISFLLHTPGQWIVWWLQVVGLVMVTLGLFALGALTPATDVALSYVCAAFWYGGSILVVVLSEFLDYHLDLKQPQYLKTARFIIAAFVMGTAMGIALTIGWLPAPAAVLEIVLSFVVVLYYITWAHDSEFPIRSNNPFAYPANVPPVPKDQPELSTLIIKEVE